MGIEIDGDTVSETVLGTKSNVCSGGLEFERENVEGVMGPTDGGEDNGARGIHESESVRMRMRVSKVCGDDHYYIQRRCGDHVMVWEMV